jgi:hypothetical protein
LYYLSFQIPHKIYLLGGCPDPKHGLDDLIVGASSVGINGNAQVGKSYVVFGKINSTDINLSSIAAGTGGFVINGDHSKGFSGRSVSHH